MIIVLKMTDFYVAPYANLQLPSIQSISWPKGEDLPEAAVNFVVDNAQSDTSVMAPVDAAYRI